jgi:outer membrane protein assembly factor BamB
MILKYYQITIIVIIQTLMSTAAFSSPDDWPHFANSPNCSSIALDGPNTIDDSTLQWVAWQDPTAPEYFIEFEANSSPAVFDGKVYAYAKVFDSVGIYTNNQIICFDSATGQTLWNTIIDMPIFDSKSSPTVDTKNKTVIIGSGRNILALDCQSGETL